MNIKKPLPRGVNQREEDAGSNLREGVILLERVKPLFYLAAHCIVKDLNWPSGCI